LTISSECVTLIIERKDNKMYTTHRFAELANEIMIGNEDRFDQIAAIKKVISASDQKLLATDRETIEDILNILYTDMGYKG